MQKQSQPLILIKSIDSAEVHAMTSLLMYALLLLDIWLWMKVVSDKLRPNPNLDPIRRYELTRGAEKQTSFSFWP